MLFHLNGSKNYYKTFLNFNFSLLKMQEAIEMYQRLHMWDEALGLAAAKAYPGLTHLQALYRIPFRRIRIPGRSYEFTELGIG